MRSNEIQLLSKRVPSSEQAVASISTNGRSLNPFACGNSVSWGSSETENTTISSKLDKALSSDLRLDEIAKDEVMKNLIEWLDSNDPWIVKKSIRLLEKIYKQILSPDRSFDKWAGGILDNRRRLTVSLMKRIVSGSLLIRDLCSCFFSLCKVFNWREREQANEREGDVLHQILCNNYGDLLMELLCFICKQSIVFIESSYVSASMSEKESTYYSDMQTFQMHMCEFIMSMTADKTLIKFVFISCTMPNITRLLDFDSLSLNAICLQIVGHLVSIDRETNSALDNTDYLIDCGLLGYLFQLMKKINKEREKESGERINELNTILKNACWTISNVAAGSEEQIQRLVDAKFITLITHILQNIKCQSVRDEACWVFINIINCGTSDHVMLLLNVGVIELFCSPFGSIDIIKDVLDAILKVVEKCNELFLETSRKDELMGKLKLSKLKEACLVHQKTYGKQLEQFWGNNFDECVICNSVFSKRNQLIHYCSECKGYVCISCNCSTYHLENQLKVWEEEFDLDYSRSDDLRKRKPRRKGRKAPIANHNEKVIQSSESSIQPPSMDNLIPTRSPMSIVPEAPSLSVGSSLMPLQSVLSVPQFSPPNSKVIPAQKHTNKGKKELASQPASVIGESVNDSTKDTTLSHSKRAGSSSQNDVSSLYTPNKESGTSQTSSDANMGSENSSSACVKDMSPMMTHNDSSHVRENGLDNMSCIHSDVSPSNPEFLSQIVPDSMTVSIDKMNEFNRELGAFLNDWSIIGLATRLKLSM